MTRYSVLQNVSAHLFICIFTFPFIVWVWVGSNQFITSGSEEWERCCRGCLWEIEMKRTMFFFFFGFFSHQVNIYCRMLFVPQGGKVNSEFIITIIRNEKIKKEELSDKNTAMTKEISLLSKSRYKVQCSCVIITYCLLVKLE